MPSKKKKYNARFPAGRIKKIMQTDEEVGKVAQAVPVIISRTLELFAESLIKKSLEITLIKKARTLSPHHMKQCILSESRFDFLRDLVKDIPEVSNQEEEGADHERLRRLSRDNGSMEEAGSSCVTSVLGAGEGSDSSPATTAPTLEIDTSDEDYDT